MLYGLIGNSTTVSVIGMCKNAGKTTALNKLIRACDAHGDVLGLTSIGRDGERSDLVTNTKKPEIFVQSGTVIATAAGLLDEGDISREILESTGISTPLGDIIIVRAKSAGFVQIGGPSMTAGLTIIRDRLKAVGCTRVFIDGAISRKSLGAPQVADGVILCSGASYDVDMRKTVSDTVYISELFSLPIYKPSQKLPADKKYCAIAGESVIAADDISELAPGLKSGAESLIIRGALTDKTAAEILNYGRLLGGTTIVAEDASRLLLTRAAYQKLCRFAEGFAVLKGTKLIAVTVNPFSAYGSHYDETAFSSAMQNAADEAYVSVPIINVAEVCNA